MKSKMLFPQGIILTNSRANDLNSTIISFNRDAMINNSHAVLNSLCLYFGDANESVT